MNEYNELGFWITWHNKPKCPDTFCYKTGNTEIRKIFHWKFHILYGIETNCFEYINRALLRIQILMQVKPVTPLERIDLIAASVYIWIYDWITIFTFSAVSILLLFFLIFTFEYRRGRWRSRNISQEKVRRDLEVFWSVRWKWRWKTNGKVKDTVYKIILPSGNYMFSEI